MTMSHGCLITWNVDSPVTTWAAVSVFAGIGHGLNISSQNVASQAIARPGDEAQAAGMYVFCRSFGMAIGVALGGNTFENVVLTRLRHHGLSQPEMITRNLQAYIQAIWSRESIPQADIILDAFEYGFHGVFGLLCGLAGLGLIASLLIRHHDLNKEIQTDHTLRQNAFTKRFGEARGEEKAKSEQKPVGTSSMADPAATSKNEKETV